MAYKDVPTTRKEMVNTLTGETQKIKRQTAGSQQIPGYGDVFAPINKVLRKKEAEERAIEERKQKLGQKWRDAQLEAADWRM
jgi:hypothetical protein